jgi:TolB-like protein/class 3 adenylate cyclase/Flp pilus assembly protein TadD
MEEQRTERRIAAMLAADAVGFSRLMSEREEDTLTILHTCLNIFRASITAHGGRVFGGAGDSIIAEFPSAVEAVRCAMEVQQELASRNAVVPSGAQMQFRIGISVGDVIVDDDNLMGDGVNVTSRIEGLAEPGGISISGYVYDQVRNKIEASFQDMGKQSLKNIPEPIQLYKVCSGSTASAGRSWFWQSLPTVSTLRGLMRASSLAVLLASTAVWFGLSTFGEYVPQQAENPSILVLPFVNRSEDPGQEYFVDGICEDIITDLSKLSKLTVIAWNTSASYKGKTANRHSVGKELGVGYILDGSVRKSGNQLRITAELVDASNDKQVWAERYDRKVADVFALQDDVRKKIVQAMAVTLTVAEKGQLHRPATNNIAAYESFLQGQRHYAQRTKEANKLAREAYQKAIELDPSYARAYGGMALTHVVDFRSGWTDAPNETLDRALSMAQRAVTLGDDIPQTHWALGFIYMVRKDYENAEQEVTKAINQAPNYADGYGLLALIKNVLGRPKEALELINKGMRLNPYYSWDYPYNIGRAYYVLGQQKEAIAALEAAHARNENAMPANLFLAASYIRAGRITDAEWIVEQVKILSPETTISQVEKAGDFSNPKLRNAFLADLRKAGLPD